MRPAETTAPAGAGTGGESSHAPSAGAGPAAHFQQMIANCKAYALEANARPIVGIMCEFAPRELILAAGAIPVCLCGGDADTIPAAEAHLPANLCPLIKSTYGYLVEKANPFLERADLVIAETTCDGKKKMFELMAQQRPTYLMALPQKEDDPSAREHWHGELLKLRRFLEERYGCQITDDRLRAAIRLMNEERRLRREIAALMKSPRPPLTGREVLDFKSIISGIPSDLEQYRAALREYSAAPPCPPVSRKGAPARVLLTGVPVVHGAERVMDIIEAQGGLVVCQENCTGLKPIVEDVPEDAHDLLGALADKYYHLPCSVRTPNRRRMDLLRRLATEYQADCVIELVWQACLTYAIESVQVRQLVEQELDLPYLMIETDYSSGDSGRIATRVAALVETVQGRRRTPPGRAQMPQ